MRANVLEDTSAFWTVPDYTKQFNKTALRCISRGRLKQEQLAKSICSMSWKRYSAVLYLLCGHIKGTCGTEEKNGRDNGYKAVAKLKNVVMDMITQKSDNLYQLTYGLKKECLYAKGLYKLKMGSCK